MGNISIDSKRQFVADAYPSDNWRMKVASMSIPQICAIYRKLKQKKYHYQNTHLKDEYRQLNIFDVFGYGIIPKS